MKAGLACSGDHTQAAVAGAGWAVGQGISRALGFTQGVAGSLWKVLPPGQGCESII